VTESQSIWTPGAVVLPPRAGTFTLGAQDANGCASATDGLGPTPICAPPAIWPFSAGDVVEAAHTTNGMRFAKSAGGGTTLTLFRGSAPGTDAITITAQTAPGCGGAIDECGQVWLAQSVSAQSNTGESHALAVGEVRSFGVIGGTSEDVVVANATRLVVSNGACKATTNVGLDVGAAILQRGTGVGDGGASDAHAD
jgi:hypothetical protein